MLVLGHQYMVGRDWRRDLRMSPRHLPEGFWGGVALALVVISLALCAACPASAATAAETATVQPTPSAWTLLPRASTSTGLGYDDPAAGLALWRDHCGARLCLRTELLGTYSPKGDDSADLGAVALLEERLDLGANWWLGLGSQWTWSDSGQGWADRLTVGAGWSDETPAGHGQALTVRILGPDSTTYESHGILLRWASLYPKWVLVAEVEQLAYTDNTGDDEWGRRTSLLLGRRWRQGNGRTGCRRSAPVGGSRPGGRP